MSSNIELLLQMYRNGDIPLDELRKGIRALNVPEAPSASSASPLLALPEPPPEQHDELQSTTQPNVLENLRRKRRKKKAEKRQKKAAANEEKRQKQKYAPLKKKSRYR